MLFLKLYSCIFEVVLSLAWWMTTVPFMAHVWSMPPSSIGAAAWIGCSHDASLPALPPASGAGSPVLVLVVVVDVVLVAVLVVVVVVVAVVVVLVVEVVEVRVVVVAGGVVRTMAAAAAAASASNANCAADFGLASLFWVRAMARAGGPVRLYALMLTSEPSSTRIVGPSTRRRNAGSRYNGPSL